MDESGAWTLEIDQAPEVVRTLQEGIARLLETRASEREVEMVQIGALEAVNWIYRQASERPFTLEATCLPTGVRLRLRNRGQAFYPETIAPVPLDDPSEQRLGWLLIQKTFDDIKIFRNSQGESHLVLIRNFRQ